MAVPMPSTTPAVVARSPDATTSIRPDLSRIIARVCREEHCARGEVAKWRIETSRWMPK